MTTDGPSASGIVAKLTAVKAAVGSVAKDAENFEGRKFKYRSIDGIVNAVSQALIDHGVIIHSTSAEMLASEQVQYGARGTIAFRTTLAVEYEWTDGESSITSQVIAESIDSGDKGTAKAMSVAYRIAILQTLTLPTGDRDPDAGEEHEEREEHLTALQRLVNALVESKFTPEMGRQVIGAALDKSVSKVSSLSAEECERAILAVESAVADRDQLERDEL